MSWADPGGWTGSQTSWLKATFFTEADAPRQEALRLAGAVEAASEHPVAQAIAAAASEAGRLPEVAGFVSTPGLGATGIVGDLRVSVGQASHVEQEGCAIPATMRAAQEAAQKRGQTAVMVGWSGRVHAVMAVADELTPGSRVGVDALRALALALRAKTNALGVVASEMRRCDRGRRR